MNKRILLIEDEIEMQELISNYLLNYGYDVVSYTKPKDAIEDFKKNADRYDIVILDLMLPDMDGFDVCKNLKSYADIPVIISSARGDIGNKIHGFEIGADDYLAKPYEPRELVLRIEAVLKRAQKSDRLKISDFTVDESSREVMLEDYPIEFTKVEFEIFVYLLKNRNKVVSREQLINSTSLHHDTKNRTIDMHISNIRQKIGDDSKDAKYIKSVWGIGYKFTG
ncbi:response regulator transcription factor [Sulfurimonas sp. HSL-1716]|uniref:response regulator transcription factor n=1 Tax=Hydrocurvibacter sulfurireducens TaxID=3131937 RepID=UPI0031F90993